jgi:hypoxanthine-guanine phosphoribosyltransferase
VVEVKPFGPAQLKIAPVTVELPVIVALPEQGKDVPVAVTSGAVIFCGTLVIAVEVQPLVGFITVNE